MRKHVVACVKSGKREVITEVDKRDREVTTRVTRSDRVWNEKRHMSTKSVSTYVLKRDISSCVPPRTHIHASVLTLTQVFTLGTVSLTYAPYVLGESEQVQHVGRGTRPHGGHGSERLRTECHFVYVMCFIYLHL